MKNYLACVLWSISLLFHSQLCSNTWTCTPLPVQIPQLLFFLDLLPSSVVPQYIRFLTINLKLHLLGFLCYVKRCVHTPCHYVVSNKESNYCLFLVLVIKHSYISMNQIYFSNTLFTQYPKWNNHYKRRYLQKQA